MMSNGQAGGAKDQLAAIGAMIVRSQALDGEGKEMSAYVSYLGTVQYIAQYIAADVTANHGRGSLPREKALSLFKMAGKCLERAEEMYDTAQGEGRGLISEEVPVGVASSAPTALPSQVPPSQSHRQRNTVSAHSTVGVRGVRGVAGVRGARIGSAPLPTSAVMSRAQSLPSGPPNPAARRVHSVGMSYMHEARQRNQHMMDQFKAHLRANLEPYSQERGLSMLRRLEENISVAKIRQQNLARKARERELRMQQDAERSKKAHVLRLSQMSMDKLREQVASFEHGKHFPILSALKQKLTERLEKHERSENLKNRASSMTCSSSFSTATEVYNFVNDIIGNPDHPLSRLLGEYQMEVFTLLKPLHSARERAGDDLPRMVIQLKSPSPDIRPDSDKVSSPVELPPHPTVPDLTSSHPPLPTVTSPPHIVTTQADEGSGGVDLLYMNSDSEDEDFFTMSAVIDEEGLPPVPSALPPMEWNGDNDEGDWNGDGENGDQQNVGRDKLAWLRAELEREMAGDSSDPGECEGLVTGEGETGGQCEDGGRFMTQLLHTVSRGDEGGESGECGDSERCVTTANRPEAAAGGEAAGEGEGGCSDGGQFTQLHDLGERGDTPDTPSELTRDLAEQPDTISQLSAQDMPDGAMFSRPDPLPATDSKHAREEEEQVEFTGLVPLSCRCYYGLEEEMKCLKSTAEPVLAQAITLIHYSLEKLEELFTTCYPTLSRSPQREETQLVLESVFFPAILPPLLAAYRCHNYIEEVSTARNMCRHVNATPKDLDVRRRFWLLEQTSPPYHEAITELRRVVELNTPSAKLACLVSTSRQVVQCIDSYLDQSEEATDCGVGVDDILPIMTYVIIRSALPQLVSETALMEEFIQEGYMKGEEGFCLTSFVTALKFVSHMSG